MTEYVVLALQVLTLFVIGAVGFLLKTMIQLVITDLSEVKKQIVDARSGIAETNGSVIGLKAWQQLHEKQDDDRHKSVLQQLKELRQ